MSRISRRPGVVILLGLLAVGPVVGPSVAEEGGSAFLPPSEVIPGMRGIARTVFAGNEAQEFPVELLGVLSGTRPKGDLILFRALGDTLARTGVVAGMSGSPVYVDGRLVGAIAFSYPFSKEPIGMITPIGEMLEGMEKAEEAPYPGLGNPASQFEPMLRRLRIAEGRSGSLGPARTRGTAGGWRRSAAGALGERLVAGRGPGHGEGCPARGSAEPRRGICHRIVDAGRRCRRRWNPGRPWVSRWSTATPLSPPSGH